MRRTMVYVVRTVKQNHNLLERMFWEIGYIDDVQTLVHMQILKSDSSLLSFCRVQQVKFRTFNKNRNVILNHHICH